MLLIASRVQCDKSLIAISAGLVVEPAAAMGRDGTAVVTLATGGRPVRSVPA